MEFIIVKFPEERYVRMDGQTVGKTRQIIQVSEGVHVFDLGQPINYEPPKQKVPVVGSSPISPKSIEFSPK